MGLTGSNSVSGVRKQYPHQPIQHRNHLLLVLPNTIVVITPGHIHLAEFAVLPKTPTANDVDVRATTNPDVGSGRASQQKRQGLLGDMEDTTSSDEAGGRKTHALDFGDDYDPQYYEIGVAQMALYAPSHAK